jgi:hypothetical protein
MWNMKRWDKQQDTGWLRQTRMVHVGEGWHEVQSDPRTRPWRTYSRGAPKRQPLKFVWCIWDVTYAKRRKRGWNVWHLHYIYPCCIFYTHDCSLSVFCTVPIYCLFFHRLKINHDSHEFILEFGTVANRYNVFRGPFEGVRIVCIMYVARAVCTLPRCGRGKRLKNSVKIQPYNSRPTLCPKSRI